MASNASVRKNCSVQDLFPLRCCDTGPRTLPPHVRLSNIEQDGISREKLFLLLTLPFLLYYLLLSVVFSFIVLQKRWLCLVLLVMISRKRPHVPYKSSGDRAGGFCDRCITSPADSVRS